VVRGGNLDLVLTQGVENFRCNLLVLKREFNRYSVKGAIFGAVRRILTGASSRTKECHVLNHANDIIRDLPSKAINDTSSGRFTLGYAQQQGSSDLRRDGGRVKSGCLA
jgi:hypothetical protein